MKRTLVTLMLIVLAATLGGCGYNTLQTTDEQVKSAWAEVVNGLMRVA